MEKSLYLCNVNLKRGPENLKKSRKLKFFFMRINGTDKALIEEVKEEMNVESALSEFIDSGFDYAKSRIDVFLNEEENCIKCMNDGTPMKNINKYVDYFHAHMAQDVMKKNLISTFGKGTKKAFLKLGDAKNGSVMNIYAKDKDVNIVEHASLSMRINKNGGDCFNVEHVEVLKGSNVIPYTEGTCMEIQNVENKCWQAIHGINEETGERRDDYYRTMRYCKEHYGLISSKNNIDLYINGEKVDFEDPCFIIKLGENINKDGVYIIDGICFWVQTYKCRDRKTKKDVKIKFVYTYIPRMTYSNKEFSKMKHERTFEEYSGYYTYYRNRLMDNGGNFRKFFAKSPSKLTTGGCDRIRIAIFVDGNEEFFGITSTKSEGIKPFKDNDNFTNYKIDGTTLYTVVRQDVMSFALLNDYDKKDSQAKSFTVDDLKKVCKTYTSSKKEVKDTVHTNEEVSKIFNTVTEYNVNEFVSRSINDVLAEKIDTCPYITQREKDLLYYILYVSQLKKRLSPEEIINNALNEIKKYERHTISAN